MYAQNAERTNNKGGMIHYQVKLNLRIDGKNSTQYFFTLNLRKKNTIILGYPWLTKNNAHIDWTTGEVHLIGMPVPQHDEPEIVEQRYLLWYLRAVEPWPHSDEYLEKIIPTSGNLLSLQP